eukprot:9021076-Heterocapsa_arctica.AAC.1
MPLSTPEVAPAPLKWGAAVSGLAFGSTQRPHWGGEPIRAWRFTPPRSSGPPFPQPGGGDPVGAK